MIAKALGFNNAECFDVIDACMSWLRAVSLIDSLFKTGKYKNALIVNAEFNMIEGGPLYPHNFCLAFEDQITYILPSFTIGEAATACLLVPKQSDNFHFNFHSKPELADLCTISLKGYEEFCHPENKIGKNGIMSFTSFGGELHINGQQEIHKVFNKNMKNVDIVFTHASSKSAWHSYGQKAGIAEKIYHIYQNTGNLVSASVPTAISLAIEENKLKRGDKVLCWVGSAGMSFGTMDFTF
jgi:3-oxoacyl-[acyl-carrier-protein] synthase III